ncbi:MAG: DUF4214 domain-containing protein [Planctomycetes bacterium]|nr:DUF4214 domain-containing protein [Planctomycetota bacterium]
MFASTAYNLVEGQTRFNSTTTTQNVYLYDTTTSAVTLVSHNATTATKNGNAHSFNPVISADGSTVAFFSFATDLSSSFSITSGTAQLYLYDVSDGDLTLVTHTTGSTTTGGDAENPFIPDTPANDYGAVNTLGYYAGVASFGIVGGGLGLPSLSANGSYVAYITNATDLGATVGDSGFGAYTQAFLYDRSSGTNTLLSHTTSSTTTGAEGYASTVAISRDGTTVAFTSPAEGITSGTTDGTNDQLYIYSRTDNTNTGLSAGQIVLASHKAGSANGATVNGGLFGFTADNPPTLSDNGRYVAYYHQGEDLVTDQAGTPSVLNVFRYDALANTNRLVTHTGNGKTAGDNPENRIAPLGVGPAEATGPQISSDGRYIAYANNSSNLLGSSFSNYDGRDQVYLFDASASDSSANKLVSHADGSLTTPSSTGATAPSMSGNGRYVAYIDWAFPASDANDPVAAVAASARLYDRTATSTAIPQALGVVYDTNSGNASGSPDDAELNAAILAPTVMSRNGGVIFWNGNVVFDVPSSTTDDNNGAIDVFLATNLPPAPTQLALTPLDAPALDNTNIGQFVTTADGTDRVFQYTLVTGTGDTHNAQFVVDNDTLKTGTAFKQYVLDNPADTYTILARTTDADYPTVFLNQQFTLNVITAPTDMGLVPQRFVNNTAGTTISQFTTNGPTNRTYQYTLVNGTGNADNGKFTISGDALKLGSSFPITGTQTSFNVRVRTTDSVFSGLFYEEEFTITIVAPPTNISANVSDVPALANTSFAQLTTTGDGDSTYTYQFVTGTGDTHNNLFVLDQNTGAIATATSGFPANGVTQYSVRVKATDADFPTLTTTKVLTFNVVNAPTDISVSADTFLAQASLDIATLSVPGSNRTYTYEFVTGFDEGFFTITGRTLATDSDFPAGVEDTYEVRILVTDATFPGLTFEETITLTAALQPADPTLDVPAQLQAVEAQTFAVNIDAAPGDAASTVTVTISDVPDGVVFSAGTDNGDGSWTFELADLTGLTMTVPDNATFVLNVEATAEITPGGPTSSVSDTIPVTITNAAPTITVNSPAQFDPKGGAITIGVTTDDPGTDAVQFLLINWGDGTTERFNVASGEFTHQYPLADRTYDIQVTATDEDGAFALPGGVEIDAELPPAEAVVAELYLDLLGRDADPTGLAGFSAALAAGMPMQQLVTAFVNSAEYKAKVVNDLYLKYLGRAADPVGLQAFVGVLNAGGSANTVAAAILSSEEFFAKSGGTTAGFVSALYLAVLERPITPPELAANVPVADFVGRNGYALGVLTSTEAATRAVGDAYELYLGREADPGALGWVALYQSDPAAFLVTFLATPEFTSNLVNN